MIELMHDPVAGAALTVDELCELARSLGVTNALNDRHALASLRLPAPELAADALERLRREANAAGLDCYLDRGCVVLQPDAASEAEQEFFELQDQVHAACSQFAAMSWRRRLQERGLACRDRLLQTARGA
ncbi:MAG TPA: hypothetical protein VFI22_06725 [Thermomicrobiales bacterium]|nr:hypothetical protein [Thermomicrobiales bacterium]